ncbi:MAG: MarR family transcriptional regulator [Bacteroidales bacterium]
MSKYDALRLKNQLCFPVYKANRLILRAYQPLLETLDLTYPQYLVLMVLWEHDELSVKEIGQWLMLNTNTLTPLLKRLQKRQLLTRERSRADERKVVVRLTPAGKELREQALNIPTRLTDSMHMPVEELRALKQQLHTFINAIEKAEEQEG